MSKRAIHGSTGQMCKCCHILWIVDGGDICDDCAEHNAAKDAIIGELVAALDDILTNENVHDWWCPITHYNDIRGHESECNCRVVKINALLARVTSA